MKDELLAGSFQYTDEIIEVDSVDLFKYVSNCPLLTIAFAVQSGFGH